jgi:Transposase DDE domain group 1
VPRGIADRIRLHLDDATAQAATGKSAHDGLSDQKACQLDCIDRQLFPSEAANQRCKIHERPVVITVLLTPSFAHNRSVAELHNGKAKYLYEKVYCARGDMENRIKECQLDLYADRTSTATMRANQLRLWFASMAYVLICALRRIGLQDTDFAKATCGTIRLKLLKIGAIVRISVRRIRLVSVAKGKIA